MQNWVIKNDTAGSINSSMTTEDLSERLSEDIINDNHELASQSIHLDVTTALANLVICLDKSGHTAETLEVAQAVMKHTQRGDDFRS